MRERKRERGRKTEKQRDRDIESCFKKECRDRKKVNRTGGNRERTPVASL